jgi:predicted aldo/keto reductase-like oxidoreductase
MVQAGDISQSDIEWDEPLGFLVKTQAVENLIEAGYRFSANHAAVHMVLTGTSRPEHLAANVEAILKPPLPAVVLHELERLFGDAATVCGF